MSFAVEGCEIFKVIEIEYDVFSIFTDLQTSYITHFGDVGSIVQLAFKRVRNITSINVTALYSPVNLFINKASKAPANTDLPRSHG